MTTLILTPAYGRDYTSRKQCLHDWGAGKDFRIATLGPHDGRYTSKRDVDAFKKEGISRLQFRFNKLRRLAMVELNR